MRVKESVISKLIDFLYGCTLSVFLLSVSGILGSSVVLADSANGKLTLVKAGIIMKLPSFIQWPKKSICSDSDSLSIYVYGDTPLVEPMVKLRPLIKVKGSPINIKAISDISEATPCSIVFLSKDKDDYIEKIADLAKNKALLTVGDTEGFGRRGLLVNLYVVKGKVKFEVNQKTLDNSHLSVSYKLLNLARILN